MRKLMGRSRRNKGESFVEILIAILIVAFGCVILATLYSSAMDLNLTAAKKDDAFYDSVSQTEQMFDNGTKTGEEKAIIEGENGDSARVTIETYGDYDNAAYKRKR